MLKPLWLRLLATAHIDARMDIARTGFALKILLLSCFLAFFISLFFLVVSATFVHALLNPLACTIIAVVEIPQCMVSLLTLSV